MSRNVSSPLLAAVTGNQFAPIFLLDLTLSSGVQYVWSGVGTLAWNGHNYLGVGSLGNVGAVSEGVEVKAEGTTVTLSGIDSTLLNDCLNEIQLGAPATIWFGALSVAGALVGTPYPLFVGTVDKPLIPIGPDTISISLALETRMSNLQRPTNRRYTAADQRYHYSDDIGFSWVEPLNDVAQRWG